MEYGGLALIIPAEKQNTDYLITVSALAHDLIMTLHFNQTSNMLYERSGRGILTVDKSIQKNRSTITYCSSRIFNFFKSPKKNIDFQPVDTLIDPLPKNGEFWSILHKEERLTDYLITLSSQGTSIPCIISTDVYDQPGINAKGVIFYITTP